MSHVLSGHNRPAVFWIRFQFYRGKYPDTIEYVQTPITVFRPRTRVRYEFRKIVIDPIRVLFFFTVKFKTESRNVF